MFTPEEDSYLKAGIERHSYGQWKAILRDSEFHFQEGWTANSLLSRVREDSDHFLSYPRTLHCEPYRILRGAPEH